MKIAIEGCAHGELNKIYETIAFLEERENVKIDLLLCCGDFQSVRNMEDMRSMAVPPKYMQMADFHEYYNGVRTAPVLTVFIGGNHESARYLWELPYGGWVAPNIYYVGYAGVVNFAGVRIGGLSGIYKHGDYYKGHFERPPFDENTKRSFYHVRSIDVAKVKLLANNDLPIDVFMSHDWPRNIYHHGDCQQLLRFKPFFKEEIEKGELGSEAAEDVLKTLKPMYWFSAHLHAKFSALYPHENGKTTRFLALDKCLPKRNFLQVIDLGAAKEEAVLKYDLQWLAILRKTNAIQSSSSKQSFLVELDEEYKPTPQAVEEILNITNNLHVIPFSKSESGVNQQTEIFCERYGLVNPCTSQQAIVNNPQGSSQRTFIKNKKLSLPKPKGSLSLPKPKLAINLPPLKSEISQNDDFGEIVRPSTASSGKYDFGELVRPSRPESPISDIDSNGSSINSEESDNEDISPTKAVDQSFSSFIETPCKSTPESNFRSPMGLPQARNSTPHSPSQRIPESPLARESQLDSSISDDCKANLQSSFDRESKEVETPPPIVKKKKTLVRRNQQVYDQPEI